MSYRHYTYQMPYGFITIDSHNEEPPQEYIAKFPVTIAERADIDEGATIEIRDGEPVVYFEVEIIDGEY